MTRLISPPPPSAASPDAAYKYLRDVYAAINDAQDQLAALTTRIGTTESALSKASSAAPTATSTIVGQLTAQQLSQIEKALESGGSNPLNLTGLVGPTSTPQLPAPVSAAALASLPAASNYPIGTLAITTASPFTLYFVSAGTGGVHAWQAIVGIPADMMTTDTAQNVTGTKTWQILQIISNNIALQWLDSAAAAHNVLFTDNANPDVVHLRNDQRGAGGVLSFETKAGGVQAGKFDSTGLFTALFAALITGKLTASNALNFSLEAFGTTPATASGAAFFIGITGAGAFTLNLPASPAIGDLYVIKDARGDASGPNTKTINGNGHNIDGAASATITTAYGFVRVFYSGSVWSTW